MPPTSRFQNNEQPAARKTRRVPPVEPLSDNLSTKLLRRSLHDEIADLLRDRIVEGKLAPGSFIDEMDLAQSLGVSRTPIREALKVLAFEGLVSIFPNRGSYVTKLSPRDAQALIEVLAEIEGFAAYLAAKRLTEEDIVALTRFQEDMEAAFRAGDRTKYFKINLNVHFKIVECTQNEYLKETHRAYTDRLRRVRYLGTPTPEQWRESVEEHAEILKALAKRDGTTARTLLTSHVADIWPMVEAVLLSESNEEG